MLKSQDGRQAIDGLQLAKVMKYVGQFYNPYIVKPCKLEHVAANTFYASNKKLLDKVAKVFSCYNIDAVSYAEFCFKHMKKRLKDLPTAFADVGVMKQFLESMLIKEKHAKTYKYFMKSVDNAASECIRRNYSDVVDFIRHIVKNRTVSAYLVSGKLSIYWFAAIRGFKRVIEKMDPISKDEFYLLYSRFDKYNEDINQAMLQMKNIKASAIKMTNDKIVAIKSIC